MAKYELTVLIDELSEDAQVETRVNNMKIVDILTDRGFAYHGIAVEGWQSYQEALDKQAPEYGYTKQPQKVVGVWYKGERIYNNEGSK